MKHLLLIILFTVSSIYAKCGNLLSNNDKKVNISGQISNFKQVSFRIINMNGFKQTINVDDNGNFEASFKAKAGKYYLFLEDKTPATIYLENGKKLTVKANATDLLHTIRFSNDFANLNTYYTESYLIQDKHFNEKVNRLSPNEFDVLVDAYQKEINKLRDQNKTIDKKFFKDQDRELKQMFKNVRTYLKQKQELAQAFPKGSTSPTFENYQNSTGGTSSLKDFRGKYVYIDVWATWCAPCRNEIPHLQILEKEYTNKNIVFISISVDNENKINTWKNVIQKKAMSGVQLIADNAFQSNFIMDYKITSIPRFILIDPQGKIVDANAPRPSDNNLKILLNKLGI